MAYLNAVATLLSSLSKLLADEVILLYGVKDKVLSLHNELETIVEFIKLSEGKTKKETEKTTLNQYRDMAHMAEDVIDTFLMKVSKHKRRSKLVRMLHSAEYAILHHEVGFRIDAIKNNIREMHENKVKYDIPESSNNNDPGEDRVHLMHRRRRIVEEKDVVGFDHHSEFIINQLMTSNYGLGRRVVSITGMGGLGKTTLAKNVYNNNRVKNHFNCRAWVYVSNECKAKELLVGLLKQLMPDTKVQSTRERSKKEIDTAEDITGLREDELKKKVKEYLRRKRYLLVLDDLWLNQVWDEVEDAFPDNNQGSKILITTRLKGVALHTSQDPPYHLGFLTEEQGWELFSTKVDCPSDLEPLGKTIVQACRGLPLSIVVIAGLLAHKKKSQREWSRVQDHVNWHVTEDETQVKDIVLKLSLDNLPARLKPCFLYLGMFPTFIYVRHLLEQWVAEGFIEDTRNRDPIDVADDYLEELIDRSLVQVVREYDTGRVKICQVHDLLRDLCIYEGKKDKFFEVCMDSNLLIPIKPRRLTLHCSMDQYVSSSSNDHSSVRSLLFFDTYDKFGPGEWIWLFKDFKLVRVLHLGVHFKNIPSSLGDFIHLRYLKIQSSFLSSIPDSICGVQNLETLILDPRYFARHFTLHSFSPVSFPGNIWKLKRLRCLQAYGIKHIVLRGPHSKSHGIFKPWVPLNSTNKQHHYLRKESFPN